MHFKIKSSILLTTFLKDVFASVVSSTFFHIKTNDMNIIVPIPNDPSLDTSFLEFFTKEFFISSEFNKAELPPELKKTVYFKKVITIIHPTADFDNSNYLEFYLWLNNFYFDTTINQDFSKHILYYLNYFRCNDKKQLFLVFENIKYLSKYTDADSFCFFVEIKKYPILMNLFLTNSKQDFDLIFKKSFYNWQLESVLVPDTYDIEIFQIDSFTLIGLKLKNKEIFLSQIRIERKNENEETKLSISVDLKIINDAINKPKNEFDYYYETSDSLTICAKIFEALEYLATENKLAKNECVKGVISVYDDKYQNIPLFNSVDHLLALTMGLKYHVCNIKVTIFSKVIDLNYILNIFNSKLCDELITKPDTCRINSLEDMNEIFTYVYRLKFKKYPNKSTIKLFLRDSNIKNNKPIFSNIILVGELNNEEIRDIYSKFMLAEFLGPLEGIET